MRLAETMVLSLLTLGALACSGSDAQTDDGGSTTSSSSSGGAGTTGPGGAGGAGGQGGTGGAGAMGGMGGMGGAGGGPGWPTCEEKPQGVDETTFPAIWQDEPIAPTEVWISGAIVTAVSFGGCNDGFPCQIYMQDAPTYPTWADGAQHAMKLFASANTAVHFEGIAVGDVVDVLAHAWRYNIEGQNELLLQVNSQLPGCALATGTATPTPIPNVALSDLTVVAAESTHGPLLVQVSLVSGIPQMAGETFGIWETGTMNMGDIVSISPFFLPNGSFTGLGFGQIIDFATVTGVFGLFVPDSTSPKFLHLYPRSMTEIVPVN